LTKTQIWGIAWVQGCCQQDGSPTWFIRSNRDLGKFGGYFLFIIMHLENQRDNSDNDHTESK